MVSLCFLCYGDHPALAGRLVDSLAVGLRRDWVREVRIGLNAVSDATRAVVRPVAEWCGRHGKTGYLFEPKFGANRHKYPLMRKMFHAAPHPVTEPWIMWFDDDSFVRAPAFWDDLHAILTSLPSHLPLVGWPYRSGYRYASHAATMIERQPWYSGQTVRPPHKTRFAQGGWWVARTAFLRKWDYPFPVLDHNGGDVLLGELVRQRGAAVHPYQRHIAPNADTAGRVSEAKRRGATTPRPWENPGQPEPDHSFPYDVTVCSPST